MDQPISKLRGERFKTENRGQSASIFIKVGQLTLYSSQAGHLNDCLVNSSECRLQVSVRADFSV